MWIFHVRLEGSSIKSFHYGPIKGTWGIGWSWYFWVTSLFKNKYYLGDHGYVLKITLGFLLSVLIAKNKDQVPRESPLSYHSAVQTLIHFAY